MMALFSWFLAAINKEEDRKDGRCKGKDLRFQDFFVHFFLISIVNQ